MADSQTTNLNLVKQDPNAAPDITKENSNLDTIDSAVSGRAKYTKYYAESSGTTVTHTFSRDGSPFMVLISRESSYSTMTSLYAGNAGSSTGHVIPLFAPTAGTPPTVALDGRTLTVTTSAAKCDVVVLDLF